MNERLPPQPSATGRLLLNLDGSILRYLAASHATLVTSYEDDRIEDDEIALLRRYTVELRDAAAAVVDAWELA